MIVKSTKVRNLKLGEKSLDYFELMKYYAETASTTKIRIWNITRWILALNAAIIAYSIKFGIDHPQDLLYLSLFETIFCTTGIVLCNFTIYLINDH